MKKVLILTTILIIVIILPIVYLLVNIPKETSKRVVEKSTNENTINNENTNTEQELQKDYLQIEKVEHTLEYAGWIPVWDFQGGLTTIKNNPNRFNQISPITFQINDNGTLTQRRDPNLLELKRIGATLIPTISNFDNKQISKILNSTQIRNTHINSIVNIVEQYEYDGIDLDYENIDKEDREVFTVFIKELSKRLHNNKKTLSVTVLPKWNNNIKYSYNQGTREAQDWVELSKYADQIRIMAYDYTLPGNNNAGPIAPIIWVEDILKYAVTQIPKEKIYLGIHLYSYEWVYNNNKRIKTNSYTYDKVKNSILNQPNVNIKYNNEYEEGYVEYNCPKPYICKTYYATPESVKKREELAKKYQIKGVVYWRLGGEEELIKN